jgi:hypothetical protein
MVDVRYRVLRGEPERVAALIPPVNHPNASKTAA